MQVDTSPVISGSQVQVTGNPAAPAAASPQVEVRNVTTLTELREAVQRLVSAPDGTTVRLAFVDNPQGVHLARVVMALPKNIGEGLKRLNEIFANAKAQGTDVSPIDIDLSKLQNTALAKSRRVDLSETRPEDIGQAMSEIRTLTEENARFKENPPTLRLTPPNDPEARAAFESSLKGLLDDLLAQGSDSTAALIEIDDGTKVDSALESIGAGLSNRSLPAVNRKLLKVPPAVKSRRDHRAPKGKTVQDLIATLDVSDEFHREILSILRNEPPGSVPPQTPRDVWCGLAESNPAAVVAIIGKLAKEGRASVSFRSYRDASKVVGREITAALESSNDADPALQHFPPTPLAARAVLDSAVLKYLTPTGYVLDSSGNEFLLESNAATNVQGKPASIPVAKVLEVGYSRLSWEWCDRCLPICVGALKEDLRKAMDRKVTPEVAPGSPNQLTLEKDLYLALPADLARRVNAQTFVYGLFLEQAESTSQVTAVASSGSLQHHAATQVIRVIESVVGGTPISASPAPDQVRETVRSFLKEIFPGDRVSDTLTPDQQRIVKGLIPDLRDAARSGIDGALTVEPRLVDSLRDEVLGEVSEDRFEWRFGRRHSPADDRVAALTELSLIVTELHLRPELPVETCASVSAVATAFSKAVDGDDFKGFAGQSSLKADQMAKEFQDLAVPPQVQHRTPLIESFSKAVPKLTVLEVLDLIDSVEKSKAPGLGNLRAALVDQLLAVNESVCATPALARQYADLCAERLPPRLFNDLITRAFATDSAKIDRKVSLSREFRFGVSLVSALERTSVSNGAPQLASVRNARGGTTQVTSTQMIREALNFVARPDKMADADQTVQRALTLASCLGATNYPEHVHDLFGGSLRSLARDEDPSIRSVSLNGLSRCPKLGHLASTEWKGGLVGDTPILKWWGWGLRVGE